MVLRTVMHKSNYTVNTVVTVRWTSKTNIRKRLAPTISLSVFLLST